MAPALLSWSWGDADGNADSDALGAALGGNVARVGDVGGYRASRVAKGRRFEVTSRTASTGNKRAREQ